MIISRSDTLSLVSFGISIPTVFLPGITETLADVELVLRAKSSDKFIISILHAILSLIYYLLNLIYLLSNLLYLNS